MIDNALVGPDLLDEEDAAELLDMLELARGERKFRGRGGTGGWSCASSDTFLPPIDELLLR